jgi:hypothetical protein
MEEIPTWMIERFFNNWPAPHGSFPNSSMDGAAAALEVAQVRMVAIPGYPCRLAINVP